MEKKQIFADENNFNQKINRWVEKKISKSLNGYNPNEVDILIDEIINNFKIVLDNYNMSKSELQKLKTKNSKLIDENIILKNKINQLTNEIELERRKKR